MGPEQLYILAAMIVGPLVAVIAAMRLIAWDRVYQRRLDVFRTMMSHRRLWLSQDWICSLNLVPVEFGRFPEVMKAFTTLSEKYSDAAWQSAEDTRRRIVLDTENAACELLLRMADSLKIEMRGADLRARQITPLGWSTDDVRQRQSRELTMQILQGNRALRVELAPAALNATTGGER